MDISRSAVTPAGKDLFDINENAEPLPPATAELLQSVTAKMLYVSIKAQMDLLATGHELFYNLRVHEHAASPSKVETTPGIHLRNP